MLTGSRQPFVKSCRTVACDCGVLESFDSVDHAHHAPCAGEALHIGRPRVQDSAKAFHGSRRAHFQFVDYRMSLRRMRMADGNQKQPQRFRGKYVSEAGTQTEAHLSVSLVAELVLQSALVSMPKDHQVHDDAAISDEALHALIATMRYVQQHGMMQHAGQQVQAALAAASAAKPQLSKQHAKHVAESNKVSNADAACAHEVFGAGASTHFVHVDSADGQQLTCHAQTTSQCLRNAVAPQQQASSTNAARFEEIKQLLLLDDWESKVCTFALSHSMATQSLIQSTSRSTCCLLVWQQNCAVHATTMQVQNAATAFCSSDAPTWRAFCTSCVLRAGDTPACQSAALASQ